MNVLINRLLALGGGLFMAASVVANPKPIRFTIPQTIGRHVELEVMQKPLAEVLEVIAQISGITLHYSGLPGKPVTVACVEVSTKQIIECLLDKKADLVFRYGQTTASSQHKGLEEVWVLGTAKDGGRGTLNDAAKTPPLAHKMDGGPVMEMLGKMDTGELLELAHANDPQRRANAIATLGLQQRDDPAVRKVLATALADPAAEVRAQAVFALAKYGDAEATDGLASALQDQDVSVRLMVVDSADNHPVLLQQALGDSDETIRAYAATKLEALAAR